MNRVMTRTRQTKIRIRRDAVMNATGMESRRPGGYRPRTVNGRGQALGLTWNLRGEPAAAETCHTVKAYQDGEYIGDAWYGGEALSKGVER